MSHTVDHLAIARGTVTEMVPVAEAALTCRTRDGVVRTIARSILRAHNWEATAAAYIAAEAIVQVAEHTPPVDEPIPYVPVLDEIGG